MNHLPIMKPTYNLLFVCCFIGALCLANADEFKPGKGFPTNSKSRADLPLSSFINQRSLTTDWSLVVLLRGETHYILNDKKHREMLSQPVAKGDVVVLDEAASSFLAWRRQNQQSELNLFWKANPKLLDKALRNTSATSGSGSAASSGAVGEPPESQLSRTVVTPLPMMEPSAPKNALEAKPATPSEEPTLSTPWSVIVILIVVATGLLWLLIKNRK
jgi:hypothetical protein